MNMLRTRYKLRKSNKGHIRIRSYRLQSVEGDGGCDKITSPITANDAYRRVRAIL